MVEGQVDEVLRLTELFRNSDDPFWSRLRTVLTEKGIAVESSWLADSWREDNSFELGFVVTISGDVFRFGFDWMHGGIEKGVLSEWEQLGSDDELKTENEWAIAEEGIMAARELLEGSQQ